MKFNNIIAFIANANKKKLYLCCLFILIVFLFTRIPFYFYNPIINISNDTFSYFRIVNQINQNQFPTFDVRTPGYPLFLFIIGLFSDKIIAVILAQSIISLLSCIFIILIVYKVYKKLLIPVTIALAIEISSALHLNFETSALSECLFESTLLIFVGFLLLAINISKKRYWILSSCFAMIVIYIRPNGLILLPILFLVLFFLLKNKYGRNIIISFGIPILFFYLLLCTYNFYTLKKFTITPFGGANIIAAVLPYIEPDEAYPQYMNQSIDSIKLLMPLKDIEKIKRSTNINEVYDSYNNIYGPYLCHFYNTIVDKRYSSIPGDRQFSLMVDDLKKVSYGSIKKSPMMFSKISFFMFIHYFTNDFWAYFYDDFLYERIDENSYDFNYYNSNKYKNELRILNSGMLSQSTIKLTLKEFINYDKIKAKKVIDSNNNILRKTNHFYTKIHNLLFRNFIWKLMYVLIFIYSAFNSIKSRFKNKENFLMLCICLMPLFNGIMVSLVEPSLYRYSYPFEFIYYLCVALIPIVFFKPTNKVFQSFGK